ncbi:MAG: tetratricopeptide repeat protein [Candidatus Omnitrophica bacterium]|nr:tetratricopeptide repeat protein [Candidatus Omnitrophota bacterium]
MTVDKKVAGCDNPANMRHVAGTGASSRKAIVRHLLPGVAGFLILFTSFHGVALSQEEYESKVPERETGERAETLKAAERARQPYTGAPATYEQVLADPDNVDLNYRYAGAQIAQGNLKGAAATLERLLLLDPTLARVRLLYAVVLFRLDNLDESERAFQQVAETKIPPSLRAEVDDYLRQIRLRRKRTRMAASVTVGIQYDTNRNAAPSGKRRLLNDVPLALTGTSRKRPDTSFIGVQSFQVTRDLGLQGGHQVWLAADHYLAEQTYVDDLDLQSFGGELGANLYVERGTVTPSVFIDQIQLSRESFLRSNGFGLAAERPVTPKLDALGSLRWAREDYRPVEENIVAPERTGDVTVFTVGGRYALSPVMRLTCIGAYTNKHASAHYYDYDGFSIQATHTWLLGWGQFLTSSLTYGMNGYDDADKGISARTRRDEQYRARLTYGIPVDLMTRQMLPKALVRDLVLTFTVEQFHSDSNIPNYTYTNTKTAAMLTRSFEF